MSFGAHVNVAGEIFPKQIGYVWDPIGMSYVVAQQAAGTGGAGDASAANQVLALAKLTSLDAKLPASLAVAPVADVGQDAVPVRVISQLGAGSGGGGGGAATLADGADVTQGAKADAAWDGAAANPTMVAIAKYSANKLDAIRVLLAGTLVVTGPLTDAQLRASPLALPSGASTSVKQDTGNTSLGSIDTKLTGVALDGTDITAAVMPAGGAGLRGWLSAIYTKLAASIAVTGTFWQATQPVSLAAAVATTSAAASQADGHSASIGTTTDASSANTMIGRLKQLVTLLAAGLPAALSGSLGLKVSQVDRAPTFFSAVAAAPAASAVIADTGALTAGSYRVEWCCVAQDTVAVGKGMVVEYRNAANAATLHRLGGCAAGSSEDGETRRITVLVGERIRIIAGTAAGAASSQYIAYLAIYPVD